MNIDINRITAIKDELDSLSENDVLFIDEENKTKYAIMPIELYDSLEDLMTMLGTNAGSFLPKTSISAMTNMNASRSRSWMPSKRHSCQNRRSSTDERPVYYI